ncbi:hypothetical protein, partial [Paenibacillus sp. KS1]|uniref:hypothetical protein n=1 Tax=Paenibacillus sp. KS1 TaxID=1849249 RepID=UPI001112C376
AGIRILLSEGTQTATVAGWGETPLRHVLCLDEECSAVTEIAATDVKGKKEHLTATDAEQQKESLAAMDAEGKKNCSAMVRFASAEELEAYSPASTRSTDVPTTPMNS